MHRLWRARSSQFRLATKVRKSFSKGLAKNNQLAAFDGVHCLSCGEEIPEKRLEALPGTKLCVDCAASNPNENNRKRIAEPLGSRDDYKRDRARSKFDGRRN
jgi:RNA polymerase-binding transcription factor DksA